MVIALGLPPRELDAIANSDPALYAALEVGVRDRWSSNEELLAGLYEVTHALLRATLAASGVKKNELPDPVRVPRPGEREQSKKKKVASSSELVKWVEDRRR